MASSFSCWSRSCLACGPMQQLLQMRLRTRRQRLQMVTAFKAAHQPPLRMRVGHGEQRPREVGIVLRFQAQRADGIEPMGVEARAEQHELGLDLVGRLLERVAEGGAKILAHDAVAYRHVGGETEAATRAGFVRGAGAWIEAVAEAM